MLIFIYATGIVTGKRPQGILEAKRIYLNRIFRLFCSKIFLPCDPTGLSLRPKLKNYLTTEFLDLDLVPPPPFISLKPGLSGYAPGLCQQNVSYNISTVNNAIIYKQ